MHSISSSAAIYKQDNTPAQEDLPEERVTSHARSAPSVHAVRLQNLRWRLPAASQKFATGELPRTLRGLEEDHGTHRKLNVIDAHIGNRARSPLHLQQRHRYTRPHGNSPSYHGNSPTYHGTRLRRTSPRGGSVRRQVSTKPPLIKSTAKPGHLKTPSSPSKAGTSGTKRSLARAHTAPVEAVPFALRRQLSAESQKPVPGADSQQSAPKDSSMRKGVLKPQSSPGGTGAPGGGPKSALGHRRNSAPSDLCKAGEADDQPRRRVSFADLLEVEVPIITDPPRPRDKVPTKKSADHAARANLSRLVANNRRVARRWLSFVDCCRPVFDFLSRLVQAQSCVALSGDVLLIGPAPGEVESALMLRGAEVRVAGCILTVLPKGAQGVALRLECDKEAQQLAERLRSATGLWDRAQRAAEEALHAWRGPPGSTPKARSVDAPDEEPTPLQWSRLSVFDVGVAA